MSVNGWAGGAGGSAPGANGSAGVTDDFGSGSGGGGGAHGFVGSVFPTLAVKGGDGGNGGQAAPGGPGWVGPTAGGGGAGGYGAVVVVGAGSYLNDTLSVAVTGGNGGAGGDGIPSGLGGSGGSGGTGLHFVNDAGGQVTVAAAVTGGNGGAGGAYGGNGGNGGVGLYISNGTASPQLTINSAITGGNGGTAGLGGVVGSGGAGLVADRAAATQGVAIVMGAGGSIVGGTDGAGLQADAIQFRNNVVNWLQFDGSTSQLTGNISLSDSAGWSLLVLGSAGSTVVGNAITGNGNITIVSGTITLTGANTYFGSTDVFGGTLRLSGAGTLGDVGNSTGVAFGGTLDLGGTTQTQSDVYLSVGTIQNGSLNAPITSYGGTIQDLGGTASLTTTSGVTTLLGILSYSGATIVNGGTLDVLGTLTGTSSVTVNSGGTLMGSGIIDPPFVSINSGGTFMPGNGTPGSFTTIEGSLAFQSGAIYKVLVDPTTASYARVIAGTTPGTATIDSGATVNAVFANGSYIVKRYTILTAADGRTGTFNPTVANTNLPAGFRTSLDYDANNVYLDLALGFVSPPESGLNRNQKAVGDTLVNYFNTNGGIPIVYGGMTAGSLTQASGEAATGAQQTTFSAMSMFMGLLTGPVAGCASPAQSSDACFQPGPGSGVSSYADRDATAAATLRKRTDDAFAMVTKATRAHDPHWEVWAMGFGGSQTTDGNASIGSNATTGRIFGTAVGADYRLSQNTVAGFAMAGGSTNFSVANGGGGRSDLFQAGTYLRHSNGPVYLSAALAYGWQDITTDRTVTVAGIDRLRATFNANAWSGRLEGGYRFVAPWIGGVGVTPYAAAQVTRFDLPSYAEQVLSGAGNFALSYTARSPTDARTELGLRTDKSYAVQDALLTIRGRLAWTHDFNPDRSAAATFQALPGASFITNGAAQASDAALATASAEMKWLNGWSVAGTFEGEFSNVTRSYAGKAMVRYAW